MTRKTLALARAKENIQQAKQRSEEVLEQLDASRKVLGRLGRRCHACALVAGIPARRQRVLGCLGAQEVFGSTLISCVVHLVCAAVTTPQRTHGLLPAAAAAPSPNVAPAHFPVCPQMQGVIQAGPRANLEAFLAALARLEAAIDFLQAHRSMQSAESALRHTTALRESGLAACSQEFGALLQKHSTVPQALMAQLRGAAAAGGRQGGGYTVPDVGAGPGAGGAAPLQLLPDAVLPKLKDLAAAMLRGTSGRGCIRTYAEARRGVLQRSLEGLLAPCAGSSRDELARLSWQQMEGKIPG